MIKGTLFMLSLYVHQVVEENVTLISGYVYAEATHMLKGYDKAFEPKIGGAKLDSSAVYKMFYERGSYYK